MSMKWPGGLIRKTPVTPAGPLQNGAAPGMWTLGEAAYWTKQGLWPTAGNFLAVEDVFSSYLYTGNGSTQTITNGIDLAGKGGLVWFKQRSSTESHGLFDTARGVQNRIQSNNTNAEFTTIDGLSAFNSNGFSIGSGNGVNASSQTYASWTFREAPKFFDVVTWTGNGTTQLVSHNLGVTPGFVIYKATSTTSDWFTLARGSDGNYTGLRLNLTNQADITGISASGAGLTATTFNPNAIYGNTNGVQYVAYLFAHDTASDGIIQCGSYTVPSSVSSVDISLGWEPQWVLIKNTNISGNAYTGWGVFDNMRGVATNAADVPLLANSSTAENGTYNSNTTDYVDFGSTGFTVKPATLTGANGGGHTYIYIAIRRGPMRTPTLGTTVFAPVYGSAGAPGYKPGFVTDASFARGVSLSDPYTSARLISGTYLRTATAAAAFSDAGYRFDYMNGWFSSGSDSNVISWNFRRAPGFFDVVCYTGTGANRTVNHNLGVAPELMIIKDRSSGNDGLVYGAYLPNAATNRLVLDGVQGALVNTDTLWNATNPTSTVFSLGTSAAVNANGQTYITYLFASCPGVSKVGTYTGNGSSQTINCGFTTGARFFLVKRTDSTDSTGNWWVWDSTRGITAPADPALTLNKSDAEVTSADATDPDNSGIIVNQETTCNINVNGASYIFLAIA